MAGSTEVLLQGRAEVEPWDRLLSSRWTGEALLHLWDGGMFSGADDVVVALSNAGVGNYLA